MAAFLLNRKADTACTSASFLSLPFCRNGHFTCSSRRRAPTHSMIGRSSMHFSSQLWKKGAWP
eukprot:8157241-Prorocentrum_lima.AAC.1